MRAGRMCFPASTTSFLGARTVPPATGYILSASCAYWCIQSTASTYLKDNDGCSESAHSFGRTATHSSVAGWLRYDVCGRKAHSPLYRQYTCLDDHVEIGELAEVIILQGPGLRAARLCQQAQAVQLLNNLGLYAGILAYTVPASDASHHTLPFNNSAFS